MNTVIEQMLENRNDGSVAEKKNSIKEIIQEITLCGLSRAGFFNKAAFYGGTALRIFHGLDRFSEDLDFSLKVPDKEFEISEYFPALKREIRSYGLDVNIEEKGKNTQTDIRSAFLKGNTRELLLNCYDSKNTAGQAGGNEVIKIKFEVDTDPPELAGFEKTYKLLPVPYEITLYDMPSLFAGKLHAVLCRSWKNRVKGRDLYDYIFYIRKHTAVNLPHLNKRLIQTGSLNENENLTLCGLKDMLYERFDKIDYDQAKKDVMPFIRDPSCMDVWSPDFFKDISKDIKEE